MKKLIAVLFIILFLPVFVFAEKVTTTDENVIPVNTCPDGYVFRCTKGTCTAAAVYCPDVYEDGVKVSYTCTNKTTCTWDCSCAKKEGI
jgi:hypothetical protein